MLLETLSTLVEMVGILGPLKPIVHYRAFETSHQLNRQVTIGS